MTTSAILDSATCIQRADEARRTAQLLESSGEEWSAVCFFYAAYHTVRGAILADPIFGTVTALSKIDPNLTLAEREVSRHQGRIVSGQPRQMGVNDVVRLLYPRIFVRYRRMHDASIAVRYGTGLGAVRLTSVVQDHEVVRAAYDHGSLIAPYL